MSTTVHQCVTCRKIFNTPTALKSHQKSHKLECTLPTGVVVHKEGDFLHCPDCKNPYSNPDSLRAHYKGCSSAKALPQPNITETHPSTSRPSGRSPSIGASTSASARNAYTDRSTNPSSSSSGKKRDRPTQDQGEPRTRPNPALSLSLSSSPIPTQHQPPLEQSSFRPRGYTLTRSVDVAPQLPKLVPLRKSSFPPASSRSVPNERKKPSSTANQERSNAYERDYCTPIWKALTELKDACGFCFAVNRSDYRNHESDYCLKSRGEEFVASWRVFIAGGLAFPTNTCYGCTLPQFKALHGYQAQAGYKACPYNDGIKKVLFMILHYDTLFKDCPLIPAPYRSLHESETVFQFKLWLLTDTLNKPDDPPYGPFPNYLHLFMWLVQSS